MVFVGYDAYCSVKFVIFADLSTDPPRDKNDPIVHLSSVVIEDGSIPKNWPLASTLEPGISKISGVVTLPDSSGRIPEVNVAGEELENSMYLKCFKLQLFIVERWIFLILKMNGYRAGNSVIDLANELLLHPFIQQRKIIIDGKRPEHLLQNQRHYPFLEVPSIKPTQVLFKNSRWLLETRI